MPVCVCVHMHIAFFSKFQLIVVAQQKEMKGSSKDFKVLIILGTLRVCEICLGYLLNFRDRNIWVQREKLTEFIWNGWTALKQFARAILGGGREAVGGRPGDATEFLK